MKLDILGTQYDFSLSNAKKDAGLIDNGGYCDGFAKRIVINDYYIENDPNSIQDIPAYDRKVRRHEIVHAFLYESGMTHWAENESMVEWIAVMVPRMIRAFHCVDALQIDNGG